MLSECLRSSLNVIPSKTFTILVWMFVCDVHTEMLLFILWHEDLWLNRVYKTSRHSIIITKLKIFWNLIVLKFQKKWNFFNQFWFWVDSLLHFISKVTLFRTQLGQSSNWLAAKDYEPCFSVRESQIFRVIRIPAIHDMIWPCMIWPIWYRPYKPCLYNFEFQMIRY